MSTIIEGYEAVPVWRATEQLRFIERFFIPVKILQQLWISSLGEQKWIDVPTEKEE